MGVLRTHSRGVPPAQDNDYGTWTAYSNHYWPAEYLIDQNGNIAHTHFGEGEYDKTEIEIKKLLGLSGGSTVDKGPSLSGVHSPEMYFGLARQEYLLKGQMGKGGVQDFRLPNRLDANTFALEGTWDIREDKAVLTRGPGKIKLHFNSAKVHMVAASNKPQSITVRTDAYPARVVQVQDAQLYTLFNSTDYGDHVLEITIPDDGFEAFTFTFG
jgi:hypothetical protein